MSEQVLDLSRMVDAVWRSRVRILAVASLGGVLGFALSYLKPDEYTANAVLFIQDIRIGAMRVSQEEKKTTPETFLHFLTNDYTLNRVIEECRLRQTAPEYRIADLRDRVQARVGRNASTIELAVTMPSDALALRVAQSLIAQATQFSESLIRQDVAASQRLLREQLDELRVDLQTKTNAWQEVLARSRLESDLQRIGQLEVALRNLVDDMNLTAATMHQKREEFGAILECLQSEPPIIVLRQAIIEDPALMEAGREGLRDRPELSVLGLEMKSEVENTVSAELRVELAEATAEYKGGRARLDELAKRIEEVREDIERTQARYSRDYTAAQRLEKEFNAAQLALTDVVQTYARAASEVFWERQRLRVIPPVRPDAPSGPNRPLAGIAGAVLGGLAAAAVVLARVPKGSLIRTDR